MTDATRTLRSILKELGRDREKIEGEERAIEGALLALNGHPKQSRQKSAWSDARRKAISRAMKRRWKLKKAEK